MSLGSITEKSQLFKSEVVYDRVSIFAQSQGTESTAADSMLYASSSLGKNSIIDFGPILNGRRSSFFVAHLMTRRKTEQVTYQSRGSEGNSSLNERASNLEEGQINTICSPIQGKCLSSVLVTEESKEDTYRAPEVVLQHSNRSGSGSGRQHSGINCILDPESINQEPEGTPFAVGDQLACSGQ